jgi:GDP-4-dehydro-6-deoxy-D-mannose reductase
LGLRVFISGATGFVGKHLSSLLASADYEVFGTSFPEKPESGEEKNIFHLDIRSEEKVFEAVERVRPDWIFHLAAVSNVKHSWEKRKETLETNLMGTFYVFEAARKFTPQARILFVSSSDVYGVLSAEEKALDEEDFTHVVSPYAFSKVNGEIMSRFYAEVEKLDIVIARSFPHTGPGQSPDFVCSDWACQVAQIEKGLAEPIIKVGNVKVKRDFLDVRDVVKAYNLLIQKGKSGEVYNVCSGRAVALSEILELLLSFSSQKIEAQVDPQKLRKADIPLLLGDNQKIKRETSWEPQIPLEKSLTDLLNYWRQQ